MLKEMHPNELQDTPVFWGARETLSQTPKFFERQPKPLYSPAEEALPSGV